MTTSPCSTPAVRRRPGALVLTGLLAGGAGLLAGSGLGGGVGTPTDAGAAALGETRAGQLCAGDSAIGLHVQDGQLREADGTPFVMRGVNHAHAWYRDQTQALQEMADLGADTVRIVLSSGEHADWDRTPEHEVAQLVDLARENGLVAVLEVHDSTGFPDDPDAAPMSTAVDYWLEIQDELVGHEDHVLINIANEPFGNDDTSGYVDETIDAVERLRAAGFDHALVVDAPNWGQDWSGTMRDGAAEIAAADPAGDVVFSIHMYGVYEEESAIVDYFDAFDAAGLALIVGEFGHDHTDGTPDEDVIMQQAHQRGIGWLAWSWSGNSGGVEYLDLVHDFDGGRLTDWGERIFHGPDGIDETAQRAAVFD